MNEDITIPEYIYDGIKTNTQKYPVVGYNLISADIETKPFFVLGLRKNKEYFFSDFENVEERLPIFLKQLEIYTNKRQTNLVFFHNLRFDAQIILLHYRKKFLDNNFQIYMDRNTYKEIDKSAYSKDIQNSILIDVYVSKIWFIKIFFGEKKFVYVLDSFAFFRTSLKKIAKKFLFKQQKQDFDFNSPKTQEVKTELKKYLKSDLDIEYDLAFKIIDFHNMLDVRSCVSIAQLASKIFKKLFVPLNTKIPFISSPMITGSIRAYHGGKNGFYPNEKDKVFKVKDVKLLDVNSMYPKAMSVLPNFLNCTYEYQNSFNPDKDVGVFCVSGFLKKNKYPIFYTHNFKPLGVEHSEKIIDLWVTSYELKEALRNNDFLMDSCYGYVVVEDKSQNINPLRDYVNYFYEKKNITPKDNPNYNFYKVLLNSLYGKFIQNIDYKENITHIGVKDGEYIESKTKRKAGGLFNPFIASLITGFSRAYMRKLEIEYSSLHTATDSILTLEKNVNISNKLGGLHVELEGNGIILRNKCYILFDKNKDINNIKYARHGFHSSIEVMLKLYLNQEHEYSFERFCNIKESNIRVEKELIPCEWNKFDSELKVNY